MIQELAPLLPLSQDILWLGFAVFLRVGAMMAVLPAFGEQTIPVRVRLGLGLAFTMIIAPILASQISLPPDRLAEFLAVLAPEVIIGLFFGLALRFFIHVLQIAGSIAAQSTSLSQIFGGSAGVDPQPAMGRVLVVGGLALAALMGLHVHIVTYILHSFEMAPFGLFLSSTTVMNVGVPAVSDAFALGFTLAAPFVLASLVYNITLGVINRAMPQLMVSFVGAPAITAGGLLLLFLAGPVILSVWFDALHSFMSNPFGAAR